MKKIRVLKNSMYVTAGILLALFASCSDLSGSKQLAAAPAEAVTVTGKFSVGSALPAKIAALISPENSSEDKARSAGSSFTSGTSIKVSALELKESIDETGAATYSPVADNAIQGSVNMADLTWSVTLPKTTWWEITVSADCAFDTDPDTSGAVLLGRKNIKLETMESEKTADFGSIVLKPSDDYKDSISGSINLAIESTAENVASLSCHWIKDDDTELPETLTDGTIAFENGSAVLEVSALPKDVYEVALSFKDANGKTVYSCNEMITVFSGFSTDIWYGSAPYFLNSDGKNSRFVVTDELLASYAPAQTLASSEYPIVLYDRDTKLLKTEFQTPKPGWNVFTDSTLREGAWIGDGLTLGKGKNISSFAIDPVTQEIYTLEQSASGSLDAIVRYPTYAGYEAGKLYATNDKSFKVYDGVLYYRTSESTYVSDAGRYIAYNTFYSLSEGGEPVAFTSQASNGTAVQLTDVSAFDVYNGYLYLAERRDDENHHINITIEKYKIQGNTLVQVGSPISKSVVDLGLYNPDPNTATVDHPIYSGNCNSAYGLYIADIQFAGNALYLLVYEQHYNNDGTSRGGIIKITDDGGNLAFHDFKASADDASLWVYGWTFDAYHPSNLSTQFIGPRKFVARKPDELVIVDEGGYKENSKEENKNRVVKVNLEGFAMTVFDVNIGFDIYYASCSFRGYSGSEY